MLLYHQQRTCEALRRHSLVVNTYNTGTGKTRAALLHLLDAAPRGVNTLFIAPTNELIRQHVNDIGRFVGQANLDVHVLHVDAPTLSGMALPREHERNGEKLYRLFMNPREYGWDGRKAMVAVTNPDIFYYALYYSAYNPHDRRNLFHQFLTRFDYVVVDEFHYYSAKQLANFLFFFIISREWGYFSAGRRVCLLSATPEPAVRDYLERIFALEEMAWISPDNEPHESAGYPTTPALAPLVLEVQSATLDQFVDGAANRAQLRAWLDAGNEGALISNALWRINRARAALRGPGFDGRTGRITGAESAADRQAASALPLILATPTVDLGYNFERPGKTRQPMDFVVFDAQARDAFLQRLGRAGRVMGRAETDTPSRAIALVNEEACKALMALAGQTITRQTLKAKVNQALPPRNDLYAYIRSYAVQEAFWPIYQLEKQMPLDMRDEWIERLFDSVRDVFAPDSRRWYSGALRSKMRRFDKLGQIVHSKEYEHLADLIGEYVDWVRPAMDNPNDVDRLFQLLQHNKNARIKLLLPWAESQYYQTQSLFNFRDAYQPPLACVYDPQHLLAESDVTLYDALHVAANFEADYFADGKAFTQATGQPAKEAVVYCRLRAHRDKRLWLQLEWRPEQGRSQSVFESLYCCRPLAVRGLKLRADLPLDPSLRDAFEKQYVTLLVVKNQHEGRLMGSLRDRNVFAWALRVMFADGNENDYKALLGTAAFMIHAELEGYLWWRAKVEDNAPVIT